MNGDQALSFTSVVSFTLEMQSNMVCSQAVQEAKLEMNERIHCRSQDGDGRDGTKGDFLLTVKVRQLTATLAIYMYLDFDNKNGTIELVHSQF